MLDANTKSEARKPERVAAVKSTYQTFKDGLEFVSWEVGEHHQAEAWLYPVDGRLEVVELTLRQAETGVPDASWESLEGVHDLVLERRRRADEIRERLKTQCVPVSATVLRAMSVADALAEAREARIRRPVRRHRRIAQVEPVAAGQGMSTEDRKLLPYANDALFVSDLLRSGDRAPAKALAEIRGVSVRSAQGRIARARELGMLSQARHGVIGGRATDEAIRIVKEANDISRRLREESEDDDG